MNYEIPVVNWHNELLQAIKKAGDGDVIVCRSQGMVQAALNLKSQYAPDKSIRFDLRSGKK